MPERIENIRYKFLPSPEKMLHELVAEDIGWDRLLEEISRIEKNKEIRGLLHFLANTSAIMPDEFASSRDSLLTQDRLEKFLNLIVDEKGAQKFDFLMYDAACLKRLAPEAFDRVLGNDFLADKYQQLRAWLKEEEGFPEKCMLDISNLKRMNPGLFEMMIEPGSGDWKQAWKNAAFVILHDPHQPWEAAQLYAALNEIKPDDAEEICVNPDMEKQFTDEIDDLVGAENYAAALQMIDDVRQIKIVAPAKPQTIH